MSVTKHRGHICVRISDYELLCLSLCSGPALGQFFIYSCPQFRRYTVKNRQQCCLVADAGDRGSDRLFHAPFLMETAGTVSVVRHPYRPLGFVPAIFTTEMERRLSLNARGFIKCITSLRDVVKIEKASLLKKQKGGKFKN